MLDITITSEQIKTARKQKGMTQDQLAKQLHVTKQAVSNWERGKNLPDELVRDKIEKVLNIRIHNESMKTIESHSSERQIEMKPLRDFGTADEIFAAVEKLVASVEIDEHVHVTHKLLKLTLLEIVGFEIYYQGHCQHF